MSPLAHAALTLALAREHRLRAVVLGLLPDLTNPLLHREREWIPEHDWRVRVSRILHSPVTALVCAVVGLWPVSLHWLTDRYTHAPHQWSWPFND